MFVWNGGFYPDDFFYIEKDERILQERCGVMFNTFNRRREKWIWMVRVQKKSK